MGKKIKIFISCILLVFYYSFDAVIYPKLMGTFALAQADNGNTAFVGLQTLGWLYTWIMPILFIILIIVWQRDIRAIYKKFTN